MDTPGAYSFEADLRRSMTNSPAGPLPTSGNPSSWMQFSSGINATSGSVAFSPNFNEYTTSSFHDPPDEWSSDLQESGATLNATQQPPATFSSMTFDDLQNPSSFVIPTPSMPPFLLHNGSLERVLPHPHYGGSLLSVEEPWSFDPTLHPPHRQAPDGGTRNYHIPSTPGIQAMVPLSSDMVLHTHICEWINGDGSICMEPISRSTISGHLITHGITKMGHGCRLSCMWRGCRLRGGKPRLTRESILRHIREKHLQHKRSSNENKVQ